MTARRSRGLYGSSPPLAGSSVAAHTPSESPAGYLHLTLNVGMCDVEGGGGAPADGQDSFLCRYLPSKITRPPAQCLLLLSPQGQTSGGRPTCEAVRLHRHQQSRPPIRNQPQGGKGPRFKTDWDRSPVSSSLASKSVLNAGFLSAFCRILGFLLTSEALDGTFLCPGTCGPPRSKSCASSSPERWPPDGSR